MMTVMMAMTIATIGRLTKNCDMVGSGSAHQAGVAEASGSGVGAGVADGEDGGTTGSAGAAAPSRAASGGSIM